MRRLHLPLAHDGRIAGEDIPADVNLVCDGNRVMIDRGTGTKFGFSFTSVRVGERFVTLADIFPSPVRSAEAYHYEHMNGG